MMENNRTLLIQAQTGDKKARDKLVEINMGLVHHIVKRFANRGHEQQDLFQIGCIGLMKAIDKFDLSYEVQFSTYAVPMIMGEIKRFLRDDGMVKVSRNLKEQSIRIKQETERFSNKYGREPTMEELSEYTGMTSYEIVMAMEAGMEVESIHKSVYQSDGKEISLLDMLQDEKDQQEELMNHLLLEQLLGELDESEKRLIRLRYYENVTQVEVARQMGLSQVQVSRMEKKILLFMRRKAER